MDAVTARRRLRWCGAQQRGNTLLITLVLVGLASILLAALASFAATSQASIPVFDGIRADRYEVDGALKAAINWASTNTDVAKDPELAAPGDPNPCVYQYEGLTVSCAADAGSDSGRPAEVGLVPPEALVLLGARHQQPGPYNVARCAGAWDAVTGWVSDAVVGFFAGNDLAAVGLPEDSMLFQPQRQDAFWSCQQRSRVYENFTVEGKVASAGRIRAASGTLVTSVDTTGAELPGGMRARHGCEGNIQPACEPPGTRADGSAEDTDPARTNPDAPAQNPTDIRSEWQPVPIDDLERRSPRPGGGAGSGFAYFLNPDGSLTETNSCAGADRTVVFLPGWYQSAQFLNSFTANPACTDVTFWFAPDPGPDGLLLTDDDVTGAFLFDFRVGGTNECNGTVAMQSRWCVGGSNTQSPRIVVGTPDGWSPVDTVGSGSPSLGRQPISIGTAGTIDDDLSIRWFDQQHLTTIDGAISTYTPCRIFNLFNCWSTDRAIRLRNFTPKVTGPPASEPGHPRGRLYVTAAYGMENASALNPALVIEAVSNESGRRSCGTYQLPVLDWNGTGTAPTYTLNDDQAAQLAELCGSVDLINGLEIKFQATGNFWNLGNPKLFLDGVSIDYETFSGASFPFVDPDAPDGAAARSDCDPDAAGAQLIFTGESHVYVADGSLEVCAGPYPTDPENHQSIGVYAVPAVEPVRPADVWLHGGRNASLSHTGTAAANRLAIGEPAGRQAVTVTYGNYTGYDVINVGGILQGVEGRMGVRMQPYEPPPGFRVKRVDMRVSYNTNNSCFLWCLFSATSKLEIGGWGEIDLPRNPTTIQYANNATVNLYDSASGSNKIDPTGPLAVGNQQFVFKARMTCVLAVVVFTCGQSNDQLEGLELDITLEPDDNLAPAAETVPRLIPQHGCTVARPNYEEGAGRPDCALLKADARQSTEVYQVPFSPNREGFWVGRASVKGTIYAPSSAIEIDDGDNAYPLATRGAVLRHLRVSGWKYRPGYEGTPISNNIDGTPAPREATFVVCENPAGAVCDPDVDEVLASARVRFELHESQATVPDVVWWRTEI